MDDKLEGAEAAEVVSKLLVRSRETALDRWEAFVGILRTHSLEIERSLGVHSNSALSDCLSYGFEEATLDSLPNALYDAILSAAVDDVISAASEVLDKIAYADKEVGPF